MRGKYTFREPLLAGDAGLYITAAQMQFFLNRRNGEKSFRDASPEFLQYYKNCCLYNIVYDMMEDDSECGKMYWDEKTEAVAISFPMKGKVALELATVASYFTEDEEEEDEDPFGMFM